jgi:DNA-directed RNA polymerase subunit RPC12/RpoP
MKKRKKGTYVCEVCKKTYEKGWSDEEAAAEYEQTPFKVKPPIGEETGLVCDHCSKKLMKWLKEIGEV